MQPDGRARKGGGAVLTDPIVGTVVDGRYRIGPRIARGGMASVYEATDLRLDRACAVKVMHAGLGDDEEFAARFVREARSAARLDHPNVVAVYDQGDDEGTVFLVMEHVAGHTLRDVIRKESPMAPSRALALVEPVLSALAHAHRAGLIHRDVKPENVLIADDGRVKVADFGLAKAVSADTQHTATGGVLIGTVSYLAPELVVDGTSDARADVYAAGVVLYELLTGEKPHAGESPIAVAYKHVHEDVPPPSRLAPGIPAYVDALVARATARDVAQRPADAGVLLHQLHRVSQALASGVRDDEELTTDLALPASPPSPSGEVTEDTNAFEILPIAPATQPLAAAARPAPVFEPQALEGPPREPPVAIRPAAARPRRSRRGPLILVIALVIALAAGGGAYWFGWARYTATPGVIGLTQKAATAKLDHAGLDVKVGDPAYSEDVPKGRVVSTDPGPGARVLDHGAVTLTMSLGKERYAVPDLAGKSVDEAQDALRQAHLAYGRSFKRYDDVAPKGRVIGTNPKAGVREAPGYQVDLIVSKGPRPIHVRDWEGKNADRAVRVMQKRGLNVDTSQQEYSDSIPEGFVIAQNPVGQVLHRGDTVSLTVSKGPQLVEVPGNLRGMGVDAARQALESLGFHVRLDETDFYVGLMYVVGSDPDPGSMAPHGSTVTLKIV